ncbi:MULTISPECIES: GNAT family N-acetyltransferase [unclassified Haladaptatus]|uniref:GNAT family N-acetyltransferase n=1 Tax=unclassified Haladaptatus TaxID=2622732 RepID=UPI0023E7E512|nr:MULTISPECIES: GNAT family N-acetyltransferase [unclassified Haladaptatus]
MVHVRRARREDAARILDVHQAAIFGDGPHSYSSAQVEAWATRDHGPEGYAIGEAGQEYLVAEVDETVVGFGHLNTESREIEAVYVHGDYLRRGVGNALLARLETLAREAGFDAVTLSASLNAVPFYEAKGYRDEGGVVHETTGGVELDCRRMAKRL